MAAAPGEGSASNPRQRQVSELTRLVSRLMAAQTVAVLAVGLPFSRRHLPTILITLGMAAAVAGMAVLARSGARAAWMVLVGFEASFFLYGLARFVVARYVGGTLFALISAGALAHPEVARAYGIHWGRARTATGSPSGLGEAPPETLRGDAYGEETVGGHSLG